MNHWGNMRKKKSVVNEKSEIGRCSVGWSEGSEEGRGRRQAKVE